MSHLVPTFAGQIRTSLKQSLSLAIVLPLIACNTTNSKIDQTITSSIPTKEVEHTSVAKQIDERSSSMGTEPVFFGYHPIKFGGSQTLEFNRMLLALEDENLLSPQCGPSPICNSKILREYRKTVKLGRYYELKRKLELVNRVVNETLEYREDISTGPEVDYWQTFSESVRTGVGDCEDFALVKHSLLLHMGVPKEDMFITVVKDKSMNVYHAILMVKTATDYYVLDNLTEGIWPDHLVMNYQPLYSLNADQSWTHGIKRAFNNS
ncbi:MAG: transglutaminase-like cysteine peptidase [Rhizobiaceae bacterium]